MPDTHLRLDRQRHDPLYPDWPLCSGARSRSEGLDRQPDAQRQRTAERSTLSLALAPSDETPEVVGDFGDVEVVLRKHFYAPDIEAVRVCCAAVAAHRLRGAPVWVMVVAAPGSGKTTSVEPFDALPNVHLIDRVTPNTFLSGKLNERKNETHSLLTRIGQEGIIVIPDFSTILSMHQDHRASVLSDMRRIYDGQLRKEFGIEATLQARQWTGRITFVVAATAEVDRKYAALQTLGERFIMVRPARPSGAECTLKAMRQDKEKARRDLRDAIANLFAGLRTQAPTIPSTLELKIAALAEFTAIARTHVARDRMKEIEYMPEPEAPTRLAQQLCELVKGAALVDLRTAADDSDYRLAVRAAIDSIPEPRRTVVRHHLDTEKTAKTTPHLPGATASYVSGDLRALKLFDESNRFSSFANDLLVPAEVLSPSGLPVTSTEPAFTTSHP